MMDPEGKASVPSGAPTPSSPSSSAPVSVLLGEQPGQGPDQDAESSQEKREEQAMKRAKLPDGSDAITAPPVLGQEKKEDAATSERKREGEETDGHPRRRKANGRAQGQRKRELNNFEETSYEIKDGMRHVVPYTYTFQSHAKERWFHKSVLDIFVDEFGGYSKRYYETLIEAGFVTINGKFVDKSATISRQDLIQTKTHRHEPSIRHATKLVVAETDELIIVNKPATIPVHPGGPYRYNSLVWILRKEEKYEHLHIINRLDRLTSGIVLFAKSSWAARKMNDKMKEKTIEKFYFAKALGSFPGADDDLTSLKETIGERGSVKRREDGRLEVHAPIGWEAITIFRPISFDGVHSIVECQPVTGRTHQIRVHLQLLGHPIGNDPQYGPGSLSDPSMGEGVSEDGPKAKRSEEVEERDQAIRWTHGEERRGDETLLKEICPGCLYGEKGIFNDVQLYHEGIWLHAWKYKGPGWEYEVDKPEWMTG